MDLTEIDDATLVVGSLRGDRDAFGRIVARYQTLICSLAYSATGSLSQSEDLAQETFATAWRLLGGLREPAKLRPWLCGILRNLSRRYRRDEVREPIYGAETLDTVVELPAAGTHPLDHTITREEEAILWRSLEQIPETYREPLILLYREHESIERVAQLLDLSEDAVRQRLVRGRKLLHEQVAAFVEGALAKTSPKQAFTVGVVAALPVTASSAKAATLATAVAAGGTVANAAAIWSVGGLLGTLGAAWISVRAQTDDAKSPRERRFVLQILGVRLLCGLLLIPLIYVFGNADSWFSPFDADLWRAAILFLLAAAGALFQVWSSRRRQEIQIADHTFVEAEWLQPRKTTEVSALSGESILGVRLKALKFMAVGVAASVIILLKVPWHTNQQKALNILMICAVALVASYRRFMNLPRYRSIRFGRILSGPVVAGLFTLFFVNMDAFRQNVGGHAAWEVSTTIVLLLNSLVVLAYAALIGWLIRLRRRESK